MQRVFVSDFETTVYEGQTRTDVWAAALVELGSEAVEIDNSIDSWYSRVRKLKGSNILIFFHNLKFDGSFILDYLIHKLHYKQAYYQPKGSDIVEWKENKEMLPKTFRYSISKQGQWYSITIKLNHKIITIQDSLKLLPFSVRVLGKSFGTKHRKLDMDYEGYRQPGGFITPKEREYIANDVLVVKEALEIMYAQGHSKMTIGACCLSEYKSIIGREDFAEFFPNLYEIQYEDTTAGDWIRKSYRGGWCYLVKGAENRVVKNGTTADVNSLYPSMMHSDSGNIYPMGEPHWWKGEIPEAAIAPNKFYFVKVRCRFYLKKGYLPFIQMKGDYHYPATVSLESSDVYNPLTKQYEREYVDLYGDKHPAIVEMTLTMTDWILIQEHYYLEDLEIVEGCWFFAEKGLFDDYINKYREIKMNSKGAIRTLAKLFLNNLYGKFAMSTDSSFKVAYSEDGRLKFRDVTEHEKTPGYIAIGSAITSYARNFTIRAAQKNFHGADQPGFKYADTDSIHCDLAPEDIQGITVHPTAFCCWALESQWDMAIFARQKTYIEHTVKSDGEEVEPYYDIKCAGMPERCKQLFNISVTGWDGKDYRIVDGLKKNYTPEQLEFVRKKRTIADFKVGLTVPGKLMPVRYPGGVVLKETTYIMHEKGFM